MNRSLKIGLACAFGAFIGSIVALQVNQYWWWLGLLVGGGVGYLSYEFKTVIEAVKVAWKQVIGWRPDWVRWKLAGEIFIYTCMVVPSIFIPIASLLLIPISNEKIEPWTLVWVWMVWTIGGTLMLGTMFSLIPLGDSIDSQNIFYLDLKRYAKKGNPLIVYFYYVPKYTGIGVWFAIKHAPGIVKGIGHGFAKFSMFVWTVFRFIHSEERVLCAFDAALGTGIGYFWQNPIIGMLAGGIFGVLNYEILSKRVLKLVPIKNKP